jgi:hypothetical protein
MKLYDGGIIVVLLIGVLTGLFIEDEKDVIKSEKGELSQGA